MSGGDGSELYTPEAEDQLDALQAGPDGDLYEAVLTTIEHVLDSTDTARALSPPLRDGAGRPVFGTVVMYEADPRWYVFWGDRPAGVVILGVGALPRFA